MRKMSLLALAVLAIAVLSAASFAASQPNVVGFWTFNLEPGFNLVSFPVLPDTPTLDAVIGDRLGEVEISTWDHRLNAYRWARYNPQTNRWTGNLYVLNRGVAYWINLVSAQGQQSLRVAGHPEVYTREEVNQLGAGWRFFGPTYGREQALDALPSRQAGDLLIGWDKTTETFTMAEANGRGGWYGSELRAVQPDRGYIFHLEGREARQVNPVIQRPDLFSMEGVNLPQNQMRGRGEKALGPADSPPWPVLVSNRNGLPVCLQNGDACGGGLVVTVVRERTRLGLQGQVESVAETFGEFEVTSAAEPGKFRLPLTVSHRPDHLNPGDRVYLSVRGPDNSATRSQTFEVPDTDRFIPDVSFPDPLISKGGFAPVPAQFAVSSPFPNPFNDRFSLEFNLPESKLVEYGLYDVNGRQVRSDALPLTAGRHRLTIAGSELTAGLYFLEVRAGGYRGFVKIAHIK